VRTRIATALFVFAAVLFAATAQAADVAFSFPDTKVTSFASKDGSHTFRLMIGLPRNYATRTTEHYPVIYLLDADFAFPLAQEIQRHTTDRGFEKEAIVVGIAYPGADIDIKTYERTRTQDYTPTNTPDGGYSPEMQALSGGAPKFLDILSDELLPYIDATYRTDPNARMIVGHSYGALFATYAMLTKPGLFHDYLVVSPSLWYDNRAMFGMAKNYLSAHKSLNAHVFYAAGALEAYSQHDMVADMRAWDAMLTAAKLDGYKSTVMVYDGDTHESVFPGALTRGLRVLSDFAGEAGGNKLENPK
jgi:hypothetical protein